MIINYLRLILMLLQDSDRNNDNDDYNDINGVYDN